MAFAKTVDEMIMSLPKAEQIMTKRLRALVMECLPMATEKGYYGEGVPFYTRHRMICFIWPASSAWGPRKTNESPKNTGVALGFCQGNLMSNEDGSLKSEGRKQVYVLHFDSINDINEDQVRALLFEASMIDDEFGERKKRVTKKKHTN
jgi:hypothetical protein